MTSEQHRPKNLHDALVRLIEECNELAKESCKALRFGVWDVKPGDNECNLEKIKREADDVFLAQWDVVRFAEAADKDRASLDIKDRLLGVLTCKECNCSINYHAPYCSEYIKP